MAKATLKEIPNQSIFVPEYLSIGEKNLDINKKGKKKAQENLLLGYHFKNNELGFPIETLVAGFIQALEDRERAVELCLKLSKTNYIYSLKELLENVLTGDMKGKYYMEIVRKMINSMFITNMEEISTIVTG